ncbi:atp-binding cassette sub-family b [Holotrichia oblita]|nr:atp-binding cassette sub-family b [Holotrichia oblita]
MMNALWIMMDMTNAFKDLMESGLYIKNLKSFMGYESKINELQDGIIPQSTIESIEFKNVTFKYDGAQENALQDFNLKVGAGEKIVIVGLNGAGKSTFIKLLMRFYDPSDGNILVNGIDIKEYNLKEYRKLFSAAFQDYQLFSMSVLENVIMKDEDGDDRRNALAALAASGVLDKINTLPKGIDNIVTREFDNEGAVLSGGESQKLIISRALFKDRQIAVFDEPSSALDAVAETRLYDEILKASKGKIIFFISHRLSASLYSDKVLFIDSKNVKAFDTHENLLKENSQYTEMFKMQAERYQESTEADNG